MIENQNNSINNINQGHLQKDNESKLDYIFRITKGKVNKTIDLDYVEIFKLLFDVDLSSCEARKRFYTLKMLSEIIEDEEIGSVSDDEILDKLQLEKYDLKKEKMKVQTEKLELNRWLRERSRVELFEEKILNEINNLSPIQIPNYRIEKNGTEIKAIGAMADAHYGREIVIRGLKQEILNEYNPEVFEKRMWQLLGKYVDIIEKNNLKEMCFYDLGDSIDGILRLSQLQSLKYGIIESTTKYADFMANWLNELSYHIIIDFYSVMGNHSETRPLGSKSGDFPNENMEKIINWHLKHRLSDNQNIRINECTGNFAFNSINEYNIFATHGQNEKNLEQSVKDYNLLYNENIDILLTGHLHKSSSRTVGVNGNSNIDCIEFPSICGIDDYSMKIKKSAKPGSKMVLLEDNEKVTYDIVLD